MASLYDFYVYQFCRLRYIAEARNERYSRCSTINSRAGEIIIFFQRQMGKFFDKNINNVDGKAFDVKRKSLKIQHITIKIIV
jgi:hypothetical protein